MSENSELTAEQSGAVIQGLYNDVFFTKLAELGHTPQTEEDMLAMLKVGFQTDVLSGGGEPQEKVSWYADASNKLDGLLYAQPSYAKSAAERLASDPVYMQSAIMALATEIADQEEG